MNKRDYAWIKAHLNSIYGLNGGYVDTDNIDAYKSKCDTSEADTFRTICLTFIDDTAGLLDGIDLPAEEFKGTRREMTIWLQAVINHCAILLRDVSLIEKTRALEDFKKLLMDD